MKYKQLYHILDYGQHLSCGEETDVAFAIRKGVKIQTCAIEMLNTKDNEFNSVAILLLWHEPPILCRGQSNVAGIRRR